MPVRRGRTFTYDEALAFFPTVRDRTEQAVHEVEALANTLGGREELEARREEWEAAYRKIVDQWSADVEALGCEVKGVWLIDWDSGDGYYCWKHPEPALGHFHGYDEGFAGRVPIA